MLICYECLRQKDDLKLIKKIRKIFEKCDFPFVSERIHFWTEEDEELTEIDTCAILENKMFIIECKSGKLSNKNAELIRKNELIRAIKSKSIKKIKNNSKEKLTLEHLDDIDEIHLGYYLGDDSVYKSNVAAFKKRKILVWDNSAVKYFEKVSETLGNLTQNEILYREFLIKDEDSDSKPIPAIKFKQGTVTLHLFTLPASKLLKIAYVSRRGSSRDESYQRIINPNRLKALTNFITDSQNLLITNPIIIAFDQKIYGNVTYDDEKKMIFKNIACSAWVIDGQHRIFAFKDIDLNSKKHKKFNIEIPVVALEKTDALLQSETFLNINYYQKKIDSLLIYDLAANFKYPRNALVWPSLLTIKLNESGILKGLIKVKELEGKKSLQTTNFVRTILEELLGYNSNTDNYDGPLYNLVNFNKNTKIDSAKNQSSFNTHLDILQKYFSEVMSLTKKPGKNWKDEANARGFLTSSSIQAFMLVLSTILRVENKKNIDFETILKPLKKIDFTSGTFAEYRAGYPAIQGYTRDLLKKINSETGKNYHYISINQIRKKIEKEKKDKIKNKVKGK